MERFSFEYPWAFGLILLFVLCAFVCKMRARTLYFPHLELLFLKNVKKDRKIFILKWLTITTSILALSSPTLTDKYQKGFDNIDGRDIVLIIDSSESMRQTGFDIDEIKKNRFQAVQEIASDFVSKRKNDRIGLVTFADIAYIASPLTFEKRFLKTIIKMQKLGMAGKKTAINDSIVQAYNILSQSKAKSKMAILLTDGIDNVSVTSFMDLKNLIADSDIKLYTIGVGKRGNYDARYLKELSKIGNGRTFNAINAKELDRIYSKIDELETSKIENKKYIKKRYLYIFPLFISIISFLLFIYFKSVA